jgi:hypothetical protein
MQRSVRRLALTASLLAAIVTGCSAGAVTPTSSQAAPTSPRSTPTPSAPSTTVATSPPPSAAPDPTSNPTLTPTPAADWYPWLPVADPSVAGALPVDSFVRSIDLVPVSGSPGAEPYRFDTGDPDPSTHPFVRYPKGALLVVLRGPVMVDGRAWYYLTPAHIAIDLPTGWAPVASPTGAPYYQPTPFDCPVSPIAIEDLSSLNGFSDGLPVCYGDDEVTIVGDVVACERGPDAFAEGATWLADGSCRFESPPTIRGLDPSLEPGRYAVTGRFLDDEARSCRTLDAVDSPEERIAAVLYCRSAFVATSAVPVSD